MTDKEQIKAIIKQYADKGERLYNEACKHTDNPQVISYWDGYKDCADGLLRELEDIQEEPVSETLVSVAESYAKKHSVLLGFDCDSEPIETGVDIKKAVIYGAEWQKEQMLAKAVEGDITFDYYGDDDKTYGCIAHNSFCLEDFGLKDRDKVKVIVIKED